MQWSYANSFEYKMQITKHKNASFSLFLEPLAFFTPYGSACSLLSPTCSLSLSLSLSLLIFGLFCLNSANLSSQFYTVLKNKVTTNISANIVAFLFFLGSEKKILLQHITFAESLSLAAPKGLKLLKEVHF